MLKVGELSRRVLFENVFPDWKSSLQLSKKLESSQDKACGLHVYKGEKSNHSTDRADA